MHQELEQELQRIDSNAYEEFDPQVIDLMLTKSMYRFISNRLDPLSNKKQQGFQDSIKRDADLNSLIVYDTPVSFVLADTPGGYVRARLPHDLLYHIKSRGFIYYDCNDISFDTEPYTENYYVLEFDSSPPYTDLTISDGSSTVIFNPTPSLIDKIAVEDEKFVLINTIINSAPDGWHIHWQSYRNLYHKNSFIIVAPNDNVSSLTLAIDGSAVDSDTRRTLAVGDKPIVSEEYTPSLKDFRFMETNVNFQANPHSRTRFDSPVMQLHENYIDVWYAKSFILNRGFVTYLRRPKPISLYLGWSCELHERTHYEIVTMTAQHMKIATENPNAALTAQDYIE